MRKVWMAALAAAAIGAAGCGSSTVSTFPGSKPQLASVKINATGNARGGALGLHLWGSAPTFVYVVPVTSDGGLLVNGPAISMTSTDPSRLTVKPGNGYGAFTLQAATVREGGNVCPACRVVRPGTVSLAIHVAPLPGTSRGLDTVVSARIDHKIVALSLNPLPNPNIGGLDVVLQYYDDNAKPSVIWDDIVLKNITSVPNVGGVAYGADGTLYVACSGILGVSNGTVTLYPQPGLDPKPSKTLQSPNLKSAAGVAVDAKGDVWVADNGFETVSRFPLHGSAVTILHPWPAGAAVNAVAVDGKGRLYVAATGAGEFTPGNRHVGSISVLPAEFSSASTPRYSVDSNGSNGVDEPYGVAVDAFGDAYVVNDYVSIVEGPPGPGPIYSTLTRYASGIRSASAQPSATVSRDLAWPLAVATDLGGTVYVSNGTPPTAKGAPGKIELLEYSSQFGNGEAPLARFDLGAGLPSAYAGYYLNVQGVAVYPPPIAK